MKGLNNHEAELYSILFITPISAFPCIGFCQNKVDNSHLSKNFLVGHISSVKFSQPDKLIVLKPGKSIQVDGIIGSNEWTDADSLFIKIDTNWISTVYYKHDGSHVLFGFKSLEKLRGKAQSVNLFIDKSNNKSENWDLNDLWLHASYNDCEAIGNYYVWNNCTLTKPDWQIISLSMEMTTLKCK